MADDKKVEAKPAGIDPWHYWLIGFLVLVFVLAGISSGKGLSGFINSSTKSGEESNGFQQPILSIARFIGQGELAVGKKISSLSELPVRNVPGGSIIGLQKKLTDGKIMEGPVNQFGTSWWRVIFAKAPSGWVESGYITSKTKTLILWNLPYIIYQGYKPVGYILSIILLLVVLYYRIRYNNEVVIAQNKRKLQDEQAEKTKKQKISSTRDDLGLPTEEEYKNPRWEHIKELMKSKNQNDWRSAIIEADIILDEMLRRMSYQGLTIGDMLKQVEPSDFVTLDKAWEAHKFRNEIAHTGSEFQISKQEAERVIALFEAVFGEFYFV